MCDDLLGTMVFNTVDARAQELGGRWVSCTCTSCWCFWLLYLLHLNLAALLAPAPLPPCHPIPSATMLTEFGICGGNYDEPESQGGFSSHHLFPLPYPFPTVTLQA